MSVEEQPPHFPTTCWTGCTRDIRKGAPDRLLSCLALLLRVLTEEGISGSNQKHPQKR